MVALENHSKVNIHKYVRGDGFKEMAVIVRVMKVVESSKTGVAEQVG